MSVSSEDGRISLLDVTRDLPPSSTLVPTSFQAHENAVFSSTWIKGDRQLLTCSGDSTVGVWDVETRQQLRRLAGHHSTVKMAAIHSDSVFVSGSRDGSLALWDIRAHNTSPIGSVEGAHAQAMLTRRVVKRLTPRSITGATFIPNTSLLLSSGAGDTRVKTWDIRRFGDKKTTELCSISCRGEKGGPFGITSIALSPDGGQLLCNATDSKLYVMSSTSSSLHPLAVFTGHHSPPGDHSFYVTCSWSSDGSSISVGSVDNKAHLWNSKRPDLGSCELECGSAFKSEAFGVFFHPSNPNQIFTISDDSIIRSWHLGFPSVVREPQPFLPASHLKPQVKAEVLETTIDPWSCCLVTSRGGQRSVEELDFEMSPLDGVSIEENEKENVDPMGKSLGGQGTSEAGVKNTPVPPTLKHQPRAQVESEITKFFLQILAMILASKGQQKTRNSERRPLEDFWKSCRKTSLPSSEDQSSKGEDPFRILTVFQGS